MKLMLVMTIAAALATVSCGPSNNGSASETYATRSNEGEVAFALTPRTATDGSLTIDIQANTHSGDLAEVDLRKVVTLQADGITYRPASATSLSGHHAAGSATFALARVPARFTVTMTGVRGMDTLRFEWP